MDSRNLNNEVAVAIIAPFPPPYGGMALQAEKILSKLRESEIVSFSVKSNAAFPKRLRFLENIKALRTFIRFIIFSENLVNLKRASVVHIFGASHLYFFLVVAPSLLAGNIFGKKTILNYRGGEAEKFLRRWGFIAIPVMRRADVIAVPSEFLKAILEEKVGKEVVILPNIVDIEMFHFKERSQLKPSMVVSRQLEPLYNVECTLRAFSIIKKEYPDAKLKIAGAGSDEKRLRQLREELSLKDVEFLGALTQMQLSGVYDGCDIMVNSSIIDNFPGSIMEAFACGLPVVTTRVGGIPYMVQEGETGILVNPGDHRDLARGVIKLLEDQNLSRNLSRNGRKIAEEHSWNSVLSRLIQLYGLGKEAGGKRCD